MIFKMTCPSCGGNGCNQCDETGEVDGVLSFDEDEDGDEEDLLDDEENE